MASECYSKPCNPALNGCESEPIGAYFVRHTEDGWTVAYTSDGGPTNGNQYERFDTRHEAETRAEQLAAKDASRLRR